MKIQDLLNQSKPCWKYAAMDYLINGDWKDSLIVRGEE